jgi:ParB/RepB/Spo0J family partition protein
LKTAQLLPTPANGAGIPYQTPTETRTMDVQVKPSDVREVLIPLDLVEPDPNQPRTQFPEAELRDLAASIKSEGLKQPVKVRPVGDRFRIIFGERRYRAHKINGADHIRAVIVDGLSSQDILIEQIIENDQRADVRPIDEARKFRDLIDGGMTVTELARRMGRMEWRVEERLRLLDLEPTLLKLYESGNLPQEAASEISRIKDYAQQTRLVQMVARGQLQGYAAIRSAVQTILNETSAVDLFGTATPKATEENIRTVSAMERKIESVVGMVAGGWRDGECVVACKVAPDRARLMADKLAAIKRSISIMESQLRATAAQAEIVLDQGKAA